MSATDVGRGSLAAALPAADLVVGAPVAGFEPLSPRLAREWDDLVAVAQSPPFLQSGWFDALAQTFRLGELSLACARRGSTLVGVVPLVASGSVARSPTNAHTPFYGGVFEDEQAAAAVSELLLTSVERRLELDVVAGDNQLVSGLLYEARARGIPYTQSVIERQPYVELDGDLERYRGRLSRKLRRELERQQRRLSELGRVELAVVDGSSQLEEVIARGFMLESSGWKADCGTAIASHPDTHGFYTQIARWAATQGTLRLAFLIVDGRSIAFDYCLEHGSSLYVLKGGFDPAYRRYGPGLLLTWLTLTELFARGYKRYELLGGADPYKLAWTNRMRDIWRLRVFGSSLVGRLDTAVQCHARPIIKRYFTRGGRYRAAAPGRRQS